MATEIHHSTRRADSLPDYAQRKRARIVTQTPMRITLAGGGTDLPEYARRRGGEWVSAAFDSYLLTTLTMTEDPMFFRASYGQEATQGCDYMEIPNAIIRCCMEKTGVTHGIDLGVNSEVSGRSGLGGSGALEVGILNALYTFKNIPVSKDELAREAYEIESRWLNKPIGPQDQYIVALGGIRHFIMDRSGNVEHELLWLSTHTRASLQSNLLYFRTGVYRDADNVLADQQGKSNGGGGITTEKIALFDEIKDIGQRATKALIDDRADDFGRSFDEHWQAKRRLSSQVSAPKIDEYYEEAMKAKALGGKIMGAGGGGWFVFYVRGDDQLHFRRRMAEIGLKEVEDIRFDREGTKVLLNIS